jgi:phage-related protein
MGTIYFNGKDLCESFGMNVLGRGTYGAPARDIEQVHVPGRNGDLLFDNGGFLNQTVTYPECSILENFPYYGAQLRNFLLSSPGYHELRDTYDPRFYRLAEFRGPFEPDVHTARNNDSAVFDLSFNCKPFRYLRDPRSWGFVLYASTSVRDSYISVPASVDGSYNLRFENAGTSAVNISVIKVDKSNRETTLVTMSVAGGATETAEITAGTDDIIYVIAKVSNASNIAIYSGQQLLYSFNGVTETVRFYNDSFLDAAPLTSLGSYGGSISFNGNVISAGSDSLHYSFSIDSDEYTAYFGTTSYGWAISGIFPTLKPGLNTIVCTALSPSSSTYVRCRPRLRYL